VRPTRVGFFLTLIAGWALWEPVVADPGRSLSTRSYSPFTQVFGLPSKPSVIASEPGSWQSEVVYQVVSHADSADARDETVTLDGETHLTNFMLSYGWNERLELGVDIPYVAHRAGSLDGFIRDWHDTFGISNGNREGPKDLLLIDYAVSGNELVSISDDTQGIGDVRLWGSYQLADGSQSGTSVFSRLTVKLPTGDEDDLHGSGAVDVAADISAQRRLFEGRTYLDVIGHVGLLFLGDGDVLADQQESVVPYGGVSLIWGLTDKFQILAQFAGQGSYFDSALDEIGGTTAQVAVGGRYHWVESDIELALGLVEDIVTDAMPDVAFHVELRKGF
jgi:hypothetical protein